MKLDTVISAGAILGILGLGALFLFKGNQPIAPVVGNTPFPSIYAQPTPAPPEPQESPGRVLLVTKKVTAPAAFCWTSRSSFWPLRDILAAPSQGWDPCFGYNEQAMKDAEENLEITRGR